MNKKGLFGLSILTVLILSSCGPTPKSKESENKLDSTFLVSSDNNNTSFTSSFNDTSSNSANNSTSSTVGHTHTWSDWTVTQPATCTENGRQVRTCSGCRLAETQVINALGHDWDNGVVTVAATETTEGVKTYTCERCHITKTETIPPISQVHYYSGYYDTLVSWTNGEDLKNQLNTIIHNGYTPLSYVKSSGANWLTNSNADHTKYDFEILDIIYSGDDVHKSKTNTAWQREHAFCASLMTGSLTSNAVKFKGRATDFHNLIAASTNGNTSRGNKNYGYANAIATSYTDRTINQGYDGYSFDSTTFEPGNKDKGRLARAIFYMATMYKDDEQDTSNNILMKGLKIVEDPVDYVAGNNCAFSIGHLSDLLEWNNIYAVDELEMQHNISVYTDTNNIDGVAQGNRNPYVDFPGLVDYVYGSKKNQPGTLKDVVASSSYLNIEEEGISHYAIKEAKRDYSFGDTLTNNDYKVVAVNKDFSYSLVNTGINNSLLNHVFAESDGKNLTAKITTPKNELTYTISLDPIGQTSSGEIFLSASSINKSQSGVEQEVKFGNYDFLLTYVTNASSATITNISNPGGVTFGSSTSGKEVTSVTIKTKNSVTIDAAFIKAFRGNKDSSYQLTIKVGDTVLLSPTTVNNADAQIFGKKLTASVTGQLTFIFTGGSSLKINSIAFNEVSI